VDHIHRFPCQRSVRHHTEATGKVARSDGRSCVCYQSVTKQERHPAQCGTSKTNNNDAVVTGPTDRGSLADH
jgi:hypothetical protein